jgi:transposase
LTHLTQSRTYVRDAHDGESGGNSGTAPPGQRRPGVARELGLSRNTVRRALRAEEPPVYGPRQRRASKLDPHREYLEQRLRQADPNRLAATVLLRELTERGYDGGISQLKKLLHLLRPEAPIEPVVRFETPPGKQLQIDFVVFRRGPLPLRAFTAELGYSRYPYVEFVDNERAETLVACLERALEFFSSSAMMRSTNCRGVPPLM